jgi:4'-phosphopantetheinyl transferase
MHLRAIRPLSMNISDPAFRLETQITLPADEVHLWRVDLANVAKGEQKWEQILSADERARAARFHFSRDRQYFTATRALLRTILGGYLDSNPKALRFQYSGKEKPSLSPLQFPNALEFGVSHWGDMALLACARGRALAVDVERLRENFDRAAIASRFFSEQEQHQLAALTPSERYHGFFRYKRPRIECAVNVQGLGGNR